MRSPYKPRGRVAHEGHLNRVGQAWKAITSRACWVLPGKMYGKEIEVANGNMACPKCEKIVRVDSRGFAFCDCAVWNDSIQSAPPKPLKWATKHFLKKISY